MHHQISDVACYWVHIRHSAFDKPRLGRIPSLKRSAAMSSTVFHFREFQALMCSSGFRWVMSLTCNCVRNHLWDSINILGNRSLPMRQMCSKNMLLQTQKAILVLTLSSVDSKLWIFDLKFKQYNNIPVAALTNYWHRRFFVTCSKLDRADARALRVGSRRRWAMILGIYTSSLVLSNTTSTTSTHASY
jgi:hypothetical protein